MKLVVGGCGGLIGKALIAQLENADHKVSRLVRPDSQNKGEGATIPWDPASGVLDAEDLSGSDAVISLGGTNIADRPWTKSFKQQIRKSRIDATSLLSQTMAAMTRPPATFISASAIGYYGDRGDRLLVEDDTAGDGFLADVVASWEDATRSAREAGIRVIQLRIGVVLSPDGGALGKMLTPFRWGLGGRVGSGDQFMSWISHTDVVAAIVHCLQHPSLNGPVNLVAPNPVTNKLFTATLARTLKRPAFLPVPAFVVSLGLGEMGRSLLLSSTRASSEKLVLSGFTFRFPHLETALPALLSAD